MNTSAELTPRALTMLPWLVAIAFFMQMLDATILNTALPAIAVSFNENPLRMQAVVVVYLLTVAILIPASGWLAERFGSKHIFLLSIVIFSLGSLCCALSVNLPMLVMSRFLQGVGGAMLVPVGRLVIMQAYPRDQLVKQLSFIIMPGLIGPLVGPIVGGILIEYATWHWIFLINIPIGVLGALATLHCMPNFKRQQVSAFDWPGFAMFSMVMVLVSLAMGGLGELHLPHVEVLLLMAGGLSFLGSYWLYASRRPAPLFTPKLFKIRSFSIGILGNLFSRLGSGALPFLNPLMLQLALGYTAFQAGLMLAPIAVASLIAKPLINPILKKFSYRSVLLTNTVLSGLLMASMGLVNDSTPLALIILILCLLGGVNSLQFTAMNTLTLIELPAEHAAEGNSMLSVIMQLSASLAVGAAAAILGGFTHSPGTHEQILFAFKSTYICVGILSMLSAIIYMQLKSSDGQLQSSKNSKVVPGH